MDHYDVLVIGGGIHGAGVLQAAAAAGYRAALLEQRAPAAGTSSKSSKLIHGSLRYLESGQLRLVRESLQEREILLRNAPDLVRLVPFLIPIYRHTRRRPWQIRCGLALYQILSGLRPSGRFQTLQRSEWPQIAGLTQDELQAVFSYFDAQTDDAVLTNAVLASAGSLGAELRYPAELLGAGREASGYRVSYRWQGQVEECRCTVLVNAAGPWVNLVQDLITPTPPKVAIQLVQGTHLEFDEPISTSIFYVEAPRDRRAVFVLPWKNGTLVGTTETPFSGPPERVKPLADEITYLQETLHAYFPDYSGRLRTSWAGLRVLPEAEASPFSRSRETRLIMDDPDRPGLIAIYGGKLTAYRATAARVMQLAQRGLPPSVRRVDTAKLPLTRPD
jgi:glycerol-3-phosphate dehydrogenase